MTTAARPLSTAIVLAIGSELTTGSTRDTNSGDLAAELTARGVVVGRLTALPDRSEVVREAFEASLDQADLVISTGGLGPTPDDLTREAIALTFGVEPAVDPDLERWLRDLFERRSLPMPQTNLKQAWLIPGAEALPNAHGTAPGWWVDAHEGRVIVAMPGPPREMWPMWRSQVLPRLEQRGLGQEVTVETLRLSGIGESALADLIGDAILRAADPEVATYARPDAVDVRISALGVGAAERVRSMVESLEPRLGPWVFARGDATWADALGHRLAGRTLATVEIGTGGQLAALLGTVPWFVRGEVLPDGRHDLRSESRRVREGSAADVGLAVRARERSSDTAVSIAIAVGGKVTSRTRTAFLGGDEGRRRAALAACAELWRGL